MSQANVEAFQALIAALNSGDADAAQAVVARDMVGIPQRGRIQGAFHGHAGLRKFMRDTADTFDLFELEAAELRDLGDRLLVLGTVHTRGRGGGVETTVAMAGIAEFADGKLTRWEDFGDRDVALAEAGLPR